MSAASWLNGRRQHYRVFRRAQIRHICLENSLPTSFKKEMLYITSQDLIFSRSCGYQDILKNSGSRQ